MPLDIFVTVDDDNPLAELGRALGGDKLDVVHESELADTLAENSSRPLPMRWRSKPRWMKNFTASAWMC